MQAHTHSVSQSHTHTSSHAHCCPIIAVIKCQHSSAPSQNSPPLPPLPYTASASPLSCTHTRTHTHRQTNKLCAHLNTHSNANHVDKKNSLERKRNAAPVPFSPLCLSLSLECCYLDFSTVSRRASNQARKGEREGGKERLRRWR